MKDDAGVLIACLLVLLMFVILFREEIRFIIGATLILAFMFWQWNHVTWGRVIDIALFILFGVVLSIRAISAVKVMLGNVQTSKYVSNPAAHIPPVSGPPPEDVDGWFYMVNNQQYGPVLEQELLTLLRDRKLPPDTAIRWSKVKQWSLANNIWANRF